MRAWLWVLITMPLLLACGDKQSPEESVKRYIKQGEEIVEQRQLTSIKDLVSDQYRDKHQRDKRGIVQIATAYIWRHKNIHLYTQISSITFPQPGNAQVQLYIAMADLPILDATSLQDIKARLYRFDLDLIKKEDDWRLLNADWWPATQEDFFR